MNHDFKVGDKVRVIDDTASSDFTPGEVHTVRDGGRCPERYVYLDGWNHVDDGFFPHRFEKIEPEPIKVGDKVRVTRAAFLGQYGEVTGVVASVDGNLKFVMSEEGVPHPYILGIEQWTCDNKDVVHGRFHAIEVEKIVEPTGQIVKADVVGAPDVLIIDPTPSHLRDYDFRAGDERRWDRDKAVELAHERVTTRGCRQQVRQGGPALYGGQPLWLVQDI